ncbi:MAG: amidohydrolase family protein [Bacillota bacterium]|nr:amidohydrolase family protein [Bacillota bacterium]
MIDHHAHRIRRDAATLERDRFRLCFSESREPAMAEHIARSLGYRQAIHWLAGALETEPAEEAVLEARARWGTGELTRRLFRLAGVETVLIDTGYDPGPGGESYDEAELAELTGARVLRVARLESLAEEALGETGSFDDFLELLRRRLSRLRAEGYVGLKSILAYRSGLAVRPPDPAAAQAAWREEKEAARGRPRPRLTRPALLHLVLHEALAACARQGLPLQFHVGFGDSDVRLPEASPGLLREVFEDPRWREVPLVLLHNYPFHREAGLLASLYANVYADLSLTVPLTGPAAPRLLAEILELAPSSKLLYASDAHTIPDTFAFAAHLARTALEAVLEEWSRQGVLRAQEAGEIAEAFFRGNARRIYGL